MIIRPVNESDLEHMTELTRDALSFASSPDSYQWEVATDDELVEKLRAYLSPAYGTALAVEVEHRVVGFIACRFDELDPRRPDKAGVIDLLAVAAEHRGSGMGTHLVQELVTTLQEHQVTQVNVDVTATNEDAVRFWRRAGFHDLAVTMTLPLQSDTGQ